MELVFGIAFAVALCAFCIVGLAVGSTAEGPDPLPLARSALKLRITRAALLATAALLNLLGAQAAFVAGSVDDPTTGRAEATVFLLEGAANLCLTLVVLMPAWTLRRVWVLRLIAVCWLVVGLPALVLTFGQGPLVSFYLGFGPDAWAVFAVLVGVVLVWLSSLGGGHEIESLGQPAAETAPSAAAARRPPAPPTHWRGIVNGVALACLIALSAWPLAQFTGFNVLGSCAPGWLVPSDPDFCVSGALQGHTLTISGRTTLADGAVVDLSVRGGFAETASVETSSLVIVNTQVAVKNGRFEAAFNISGSPLFSFDSIVATATVRMDEQPSAVIKHYGSDGHNMAGPAVRAACGEGGGRCLLVTMTWNLPPN